MWVMRTFQENNASRRQFLRFLAGSPLLAYGGIEGNSKSGSDVTAPSEAINVFDLEEIARKSLPPAHFGFLSTGVDDEITLRANREGFLKFKIRSRRLVDTRQIDMRVKLFGVEWPTPIILAPVASQRAFHVDGELATAKAARARNHLPILSTNTTTSVEDVGTAFGAPVWYQLYPTPKWSVTQGLVKRAQAAGCPVVALTVDQATPGSRETFVRARKQDARVCTDCHAGTPGSMFLRKPMYNELDTSGLVGSSTPHLTWEFVDRLKDLTTMKVILKGIVTEEDAALALEHGVDGVIVSNHGGRGEESGRSTIESLPEVVDAIGGKIPVLIDSGFRRGTDIFKALALGAKGVCVGRPYLWGLAAHGQPGVEVAADVAA